MLIKKINSKKNLRFSKTPSKTLRNILKCVKYVFVTLWDN